MGLRDEVVGFRRGDLRRLDGLRRPGGIVESNHPVGKSV
jgi:hypothetical protein